jgi:hypothetical protein
MGLKDEEMEWMKLRPGIEHAFDMECRKALWRLGIEMEKIIKTKSKQNLVMYRRESRMHEWRDVCLMKMVLPKVLVAAKGKVLYSCSSFKIDSVHLFHVIVHLPLIRVKPH